MATWTSLGHAMRRRIGAPSNHHESTGKSMSRNQMTPDEVIASAEHANSARRYMGMTNGFTSPSATPAAGKLMGKKNTQAADPTAGGKANKKNVLAGNAVQSERMGARYVIGENFPAVHQSELGPTMANAKIVPSVSGKNRPNFDNGIDSTY
jgi:hypothetical protein